jgi:hydrogenase maturation protein HypF
MSLEFAAEKYEKDHPAQAAGIFALLGFEEDLLRPAQDDQILRCRTTELFGWIAGALLGGADRQALAYLFHAALARMAVNACIRIREKTGISAAALSGGVFQNQLLVRLCADQLEEAGFQVLTHSMLPPNDGGICLGQAVYGARYLEKQREV